MSLKSRKKILIISFHFPPSTLVGAKRFAFLSQILHKKYKVNVLTINEKYMSPKDLTINFGGILHRTAMYPSFNPIERKMLKRIFNSIWKRYLCAIDPYIGWILPAMLKGLKIVKRRGIDLIISTGPPFTTMVIGFLLSKMTSTNLILDYRDPWTNKIGGIQNIIRLKIMERLERMIVKHASALIFCSPAMKEDFVERFGEDTEKIYHVITNGFYNKDNIQGLSLGKFQKNVIYAGNFYGERKIKLLANAIIHAMDKGIITKENFCLHIFGKICREDKLAIIGYGLQDLVKEYPQVSYEKSIKYLEGAAILFLLSGSDMKYSIPYKFFDYLSVKRPILGVAPENSAVERIMSEIDCGRMAIINNEESILSNFCAMLREGNIHTYEGAEQYTWGKIAKRYSKVIDEVAKLD
jgi:glycosyltransferase involved in cell wall biosynthesis